MNLQAILLTGLLLGNNMTINTSYYKTPNKEQEYEKKQKEIHLEQVNKNPRDIVAPTELAEYYVFVNYLFIIKRCA